MRQEQGQGDEAGQVADERGGGRLSRFAHRLEEDGGHLDEAGEGDEGEEDAEGLDGKLPIQRVALAENAHDELGAKLKDQRRGKAHGQGGGQDQLVRLADAVVFLRAVVIAQNGLAAQDHADDDVDDDGIDLRLDADDGNGDVRPVDGQGAVVRQHEVADQGDDHDGNLRHKGRDAQLNGRKKHPPVGFETGFFQPEALGLPQQIHGVQDEGQDLPRHGRPGRALDPPVQAEDEDGVQDDVRHRTGDGGDHGILGAAVGPDRPVGGVRQHVEGEGPQQDRKILHGHADGRVRGTKEAEQRLLPDAADDHQKNAGGKGHGDSAADAAVGALGVAPALAEAEVGRAAVPHAPAEGHGDHQQGEDHPRGGVAQVPQLTVADEDLIDDVVQGADEQRQDAGQGEGAQQFSQVVPAQVGVVFECHKNLLNQRNEEALVRKNHPEKPGQEGVHRTEVLCTHILSGVTLS